MNKINFDLESVVYEAVDFCCSRGYTDDWSQNQIASHLYNHIEEEELLTEEQLEQIDENDILKILNDMEG